MKLIYILSAFLILMSCTREMEFSPLGELGDANFWGDPNLSETFVNGIYYTLIKADEYMQEENLSDNGYTAMEWISTNSWILGHITSTTIERDWQMSNDYRGAAWETGCETFWQLNYRELRKANLAIQQLSIQDWGNEEKRRKRLLGEAYFLRAYKYFDIYKRYGAFIVVDKPLTFEDDLNLPRNSEDECVEFMSNDCDSAAFYLPWQQASTEQGRATKGASLSLKGRVLLFGEKWAESAETSKAVLDAAGETGYQLYPDYSKVFSPTNKYNSEVVFDISMQEPLQAWYPLWGPNSYGGWGGTCPTQDLVDEYEYIDGKIGEASQYYDPQNPWDNRDPRFYATIMYDGGVYWGHYYQVGEGVDGAGDVINGGNYGSHNTYTGYNTWKWFEPEMDPWNASEKEHPNYGVNVIVIRYAEVYLNYAEAKNEASGPDQSVYDAVNAVRARAGMPALASGLNQEQMRKAIRHERRIELAFEWSRIWDVLRWKDESLLVKPITIVNVIYELDLNEEGIPLTNSEDARLPYVIKSRTIEYDTLIEHNVNLKDFGYHWPIPQTEIDKNPNLVQNSSAN
ncbi:MAG: RagB/SusD family nutrient uptake outer membrane protein [Prolixibacteraceae bacterium]